MIPYKVITFFLSFSIFFGVMFEAYSYYFRSFAHDNIVYSTVLSNWILYLSRVCNVFIMILMAYLIEFNGNISDSMLVFFGVHTLCFFYIYFILLKLRADLFFNLFIFIIRFIYKVNLNYRFNIIKQEKLSLKIYFSSLTVSFFVYLSVILPSLAAHNFFEYRMTLTYISSIFNFFASGILLTYIEPSFAIKSNTDLYQKAFYSIFMGKITAQLFIALSSLTLHFLIN